MPWQEVCTMEERMKFVLAAAGEEDSMAALCEDYGVSRKTGYKWLQRYLAEGPAGLAERSHAPQVVPWAVTQAHSEAIVAMRRLLLDAIAVNEKGGTPRAVDPKTYRNVRAYDRVVPTGQDWRIVMEKDLVAIW